MTITLPWPPSVNAMWRSPRSGALAGRTLLSATGRAYRRDVCAAIGQRSPFAGPLRVVIEARMPDKRRRDLDNIPKAVLDAMTHAGVWSDDSQIDDLRVWRSRQMGGCVVVTVHGIDAQEEV